MKEVRQIKEGKERHAIKIGFTKDGDHYIFSEGCVPNYKFETTLEYQKTYKQDGTTLVEWRDTTTDKLLYSGINVLHNSLIGQEAEIVQADKYQIRSKFTFIKIDKGPTLLTFSKN